MRNTHAPPLCASRLASFISLSPILQHLRRGWLSGSGRRRLDSTPNPVALPLRFFDQRPSITLGGAILTYLHTAPCFFFRFAVLLTWAVRAMAPRSMTVQPDRALVEMWLSFPRPCFSV